MSHSSRGKSPKIVCVASSAGGLAPLEALIQNLKTLDRLMVIIAQHSSPGHESLLPALLSRHTSVTIDMGEDGMPIQAGHIIIIPPGNNGIVLDRQLVLEPVSQGASPRPNANRLFSSVAQEYGEQAVAIVLSGTGSDGALGCREIKAHGGFVLVEDPKYSKYGSMPQSVIDLGCADLILSPQEIGQKVDRLLDLKPNQPVPLPENDDQSLLSQLFRQLQERYQLDFSGYKRNTLSRRINRRLVATDSKDLSAYVRYVEQYPQELAYLYQDFLISVTRFFRDSTAFEELKPLIQELRPHLSEAHPIRIWVAGCASGEEAYSLAMLLHQLYGWEANEATVHIFASDKDDKALDIARRGIYSLSLVQNLDADLIQHYFEKREHGYAVRKFIRNMVIFTNHNLLTDPPFLQLDLISCRNVLIYLEDELKAKAMDIFNYSLNHQGLLFLGKSESTSRSSHFRKKSKDHKIYYCVKETRSLPPKMVKNLRPTPSDARPSGGDAVVITRDEATKAAIEQHFLASSFVVDKDLKILYIYGDINRICTLQRGALDNTINSLVHPDFLFELKSLVYLTQQSNRLRRSAPIVSGDVTVIFEAAPLLNNSTDTSEVLVRIQEYANPSDVTHATDQSDTGAIIDLKHQLMVGKEQLQSVIEELETSNEELQSVNEELQSSNEELQSTNEELETTNEELQSTNEELVTVNEELQTKNTEIEQLVDDIFNTYNSIPHPTLLIDSWMNVIHHNDACAQIFKYKDSMVGTNIGQIKALVTLPRLDEFMEQEIPSPTNLQVTSTDDKHYWLTVAPFNNPSKREGAVLLFWDNTELIKLYSKLDESIKTSNLQGKALEAANQGIIIVDAQEPNHPIIYTNEAFTRITGYSKEEVFGRNCRFLQGPDTSRQTVNDIADALDHERTINCQIINYRKDGSEFYNRLDISPIYNEGQLTHFIGIQTDISDIIQSEKESAFSKSVFDKTQEAILILDGEQQVQYSNPATHKTFRVSNNRLLGRKVSELIPFETLKSHKKYGDIWRTVKKYKHWQGQLQVTVKEKSIIVLASINAVVAPNEIGEYFVMLATDITELKKTERELRTLASYDPLTQLANRKLFRDLLKETIARNSRRDRTFALLFLDLDNFKRINDTLGHKVGDDVLVHFTETVNGLIREGDTFGRMSGDEFVLILDGVENPTQAQQFSQRVIDAIERPYRSDQGELLLTVSIGIAMFPEDGRGADQLLRNSDLAMYRAKQAGKSQVGFADPERSAVLKQQLQIEADLRRCLHENEDVGLYLVFQPMFSAASPNELYGFEVLIRWEHPALGNLTPNMFLPIAESAGFSKRLDIWVINQFIVQYTQWHRLYDALSDLQYAININPTNSHLLTQSQISALLSHMDNDINRPRLTFEITENALINKTPALLDGLKSLSEMNTVISIDDFGAGYSNFNYITDLDVIQQIKLDKSLVDDIDSSAVKLNRIRAIIKMLKELGYTVVVEGIETERQSQLLLGAGHDVIQGYFHSRPLIPAQAETLIEARKRSDILA